MKPPSRLPRELRLIDTRITAANQAAARSHSTQKPRNSNLGVGQRYQREGPAQQPAVPATSGQPKHNYVDLLIQKHQESLRQRSSGIDYQAVLARGQSRWPFLEFVKHLASHLGQSGGASAFRCDELETLQKVHDRLTRLDAPLLEQACARARERTIPEIVFLLQQLHDERSP